jgi:two-component system phosphate regulon response regulator PhoB
VEDEPGVQELLKLNLSMCGYLVDQAFDVDEAQRWLGENKPDLVLTDWNVPGRSGVSLVRLLRNHEAHKLVPIIMLTARDEVADKLLAFDAGADDYVTKPFRVSELMARVKTLLRRADWGVEPQRNLLNIDGLVLNDTEKCVLVGQHRLRLNAAEYKLLLLLVRRPMMVYSRQQLIELVWGAECGLQERTVDVAVARLRAQLDALGHHRCIETVRSMGYRFLRREDLVPHNG